MLNFNRDNRPADPKDQKLPGRPAPLGPAPGTPAPAAAVPRAPVAPTQALDHAHVQPATEIPGSKLSIGVNINLKGVEISNCDVILIEGNVDATIHSKVMEIGKPGRLNGTAIIDIAEIHGDFSGELTARSKLVVHGTGRVSGTIRYGKLVVAEGGTLTGELKQIDADETAKSASSAQPSAPRPLLNPQPH